MVLCEFHMGRLLLNNWWSHSSRGGRADLSQGVRAVENAFLLNHTSFSRKRAMIHSYVYLSLQPSITFSFLCYVNTFNHFLLQITCTHSNHTHARTRAHTRTHTHAHTHTCTHRCEQSRRRADELSRHVYVHQRLQLILQRDRHTRTNCTGFLQTSIPLEYPTMFREKLPEIGTTLFRSMCTFPMHVEEPNHSRKHILLKHSNDWWKTSR